MNLATLEQGDHVCAMYSSPEQQLKVITNYIKQGLDLGERCLYIVDDRAVGDVYDGLAANRVHVIRQE
jgi:hypothetical protein